MGYNFEEYDYGNNRDITGIAMKAALDYINRLVKGHKFDMMDMSVKVVLQTPYHYIFQIDAEDDLSIGYYHYIFQIGAEDDHSEGYIDVFINRDTKAVEYCKEHNAPAVIGVDEVYTLWMLDRETGELKDLFSL